MSSTGNDSDRKPIAIVGMSGRFPGGANSLTALWQKLQAREDMVGEWPEGRWNTAFFHPDKERPGRIYTRAGGFLDQIDQFDADFFGFSPREVAQMDPQQRLLLEMSWEALENGGLLPHQLAGTAGGVFIGISSNDYGSLHHDDLSTINAYSNSGGALSIAANRLSYFYDLKGPSMAIDTACSSALVAVHEACQSLWSGESAIALAGGVNTLVVPTPYIGFCKASMLSPAGRCKSFDATGDGYVRAEGGAVVVLKPLQDAERDRDNILGLIVASGVNSDGRTRGLSLPSEAAQEALLRQVYARASLATDKVFYVEAHGTGTSVGDPIECNAIGRVLGAGRASGRPCYIGSIKSNLGHLEPASACAGIAKVLLALKHREIPANLHFSMPNPKIHFEELNLKVVADPLPLPESSEPLLMGINSFGFGGTNAHVVIQQYLGRRSHGAAASGKSAASAVQGEKPALNRPLVLSARSATALRAMASDYASFVRGPQAPQFPSICAAAANRRTRHPHRLAVLGATGDELGRRLESFAAGASPAGLAAVHTTQDSSKLVFVFCGNGPQWWGMGRELLEKSPLFRATVDAIDDHFAPLAGWSIRAEMAVPQEASRISRTEVAQPLLFALQAGLTALLHESGLRPTATVGHSVGEIAAAYAAGALSLADAVRIVFERSRAQARTAGLGKMAAVGAGAEQLRHHLKGFEGRLEIAAINSPRSVTVAGDQSALEQLRKRLAAEKVFCKVLALDYAFHSYVMNPLRESLLDSLSKLKPAPEALPFISTVTGGPLSGTSLDAQYWWRNLRDPVQFSPAIEALLGQGIGLFLEIGPHPVLRDYIGEIVAAAQKPALALTTLRRPSPGSRESDSEAILTAISSCYAHGADSDLITSAPTEPVELPSYPWQRQSFWSGGEVGLPEGGGARAGRSEHPLLGYRLQAADPSWEGTLDPELIPYLRDHNVQGATVFPAAGYLEMAMAAARLVFGDSPCEVEDFDIRKALVIPEGNALAVQCVVDQEQGFFRISSRADGTDAEWALHAIGRLGRMTAAEPRVLALDRMHLSDHVDRATHYAAAAARGLAYGPAFQGIANLWVGDDEVIAVINAPPEVADDLDAYHVHPALLDACLQALIGLVARDPNHTSAYLPVALKRFRLYAGMNGFKFCRVHVDSRQARSLTASFQLLAEDGTLLAEIDRFRFQAIDFDRAAEVSTYHYEWQLAHSYTEAEVVAIAPTAIAKGSQPVIELLIEEMDRRRFYAVTQAQCDRLASAYAIGALRTLGADAGPFTVDLLAARGAVVPEHRRLLACLCAMAVKDGYLKRAAQGWKLTRKLPVADADELWRELMRDRPDHAAELLLMHRCGVNLAPIMRDEIDPLNLLFPEKGGGTLEHLYDTGPSFRIYNRIAAAAVSEIVAHWPLNRPLRVVEIGGGTGGLTASILPLLPADRTAYLFSDISENFVGRAQARFASYRFVEYKTLDLERDFAEQGFAPGSFDLILAADAVHAAGDLLEALRRTHGLLAAGGLLLMIEQHPEHAADIIFGALKEWWNFTDYDLRPDSALLSPKAWPEVLTQAGFAETVILSDAEALTDGADRVTQHSVFLTRKVDAVQPPRTDTVSAAAEPRRWLLLADEEGPGNALSSTLLGSLSAQGHEVVRVNVNGAYSRGGPDTFSVGARYSQDLLKVVDTLHAEGREFEEIIHLAGFAAAESPAPAEMLQFQDSRCLAAMHLVQALAHSAMPAHPRLTLVTAGSHPSPVTMGNHDPLQSPLWGLGRVVMNEHPELNCRLIDLHIPPQTSEASARLLAELQLTDDEDEVLLTRTGRYVHRVKPHTANQSMPVSAAPSNGHQRDSLQGFRLGLETYGNLDSFRLSKVERVAPGPGQVEIRVRAAGLNFRDVMFAMGLLPEDALEHGFAGPTLGLECAGEIERVGLGVTEFVPGDRVIGFGSSCLGSYIVTTVAAVGMIPAGLSFEAAATIPTTFFTAYYALKHLARLQAGECILIHGGAGGVGLAAIQIAQLLGAEIFATAGTDEKREMLKTLGVEHVLNSRTLAFADEVQAITGGRGVDVVLNSLAGDAMWKSISVLRFMGRFIELGKRDYVANTRIGLRPFRNNLSYFGVDADQMLLHAPELTKVMMSELLGLFDRGKLHPLPYRAFSMDRGSEAFRLMQQSRHIGKIVLTTDVSPLHLQQLSAEDFVPRPDATYLVTGGLTGLGLATAQWLVKKGARHLALIGRRGARTPEAAEGIASMEAAGASVRAFAADITDPEAMTAVMTAINSEMPALRGVIHAAMVLDDGIILQLDRERLHRALAPKMVGAWLLHQMTLGESLDFFVLYSSGTTLFGNPGQANYVAGCMFLESLAEYRRARGLPGLALSWGAIGEVGYLARNAGVAQLVTNRTGLKLIAPKQAMTVLERLLATDATRVAAVSVDWQRWRQSVPVADRPRFAGLLGGAAGATPTASADFGEALRALASEERLPALIRHVSQLIGRVMGMAAAQLDVNRPLDQLGIDSLMTVEVGSMLEESLGIKVPSMALMDGSITDLSRRVLALIEGAATAPAVADPVPSVLAEPPTNGRSMIVRLAPSSSAEMKLVTIPYMGGGTSVFASWSKHFGGRVELISARNTGYAEDSEHVPYTDLAKLVEDLGRELLPQLDRPYAIYGHSLGAAIGFELARWLRQAGADQMQHLFVAAYGAPQLESPLANYMEGLAEDAIERVSSNSAWAGADQLQPLLPAAVLRDRAPFRKALPVVKAGLTMIARHRYISQAPLGCPITVFAGAEDQIFSLASQQLWALETSNRFALIEVPGNHLFVRDQAELITTAIREALKLDLPPLTQPVEARA